MLLLSDARIHFLMTEYMVTTDEFKDLYFKRWPIETQYDIVGIKLHLENFTGKTVLSVLQDFHTSMYLSNIATFAKYITDAKIQKNNENKGLKYIQDKYQYLDWQT